jgi:hypothetical protein
MILSRRSFLTGLIAAPIIVRAGIIMPVKPIDPADFNTENMKFTATERMPEWFEVYGLDQHGNYVSNRVRLPDIGTAECTKKFRTVTHIVSVRA